jgi:hypothetical protein
MAANKLLVEDVIGKKSVKHLQQPTLQTLKHCKKIIFLPSKVEVLIFERITEKLTLTKNCQKIQDISSELILL